MKIRTELYSRRFRPGRYGPTKRLHLYQPVINPEHKVYGKLIPEWRGWRTRCGAFQSIKDVELDNWATVTCPGCLRDDKYEVDLAIGATNPVCTIHGDPI